MRRGAITLLAGVLFSAAAATTPTEPGGPTIVRPNSPHPSIAVPTSHRGALVSRASSGKNPAAPPAANAPAARAPLAPKPRRDRSVWRASDFIRAESLSTSEPQDQGDEPVSWTNVVAASVSGNTLTKTAATTGWDAGAASANLIRDGFGYVEFTKTETAGRIMVGLSHGDSGVAYEDVDYAIHTD